MSLRSLTALGWKFGFFELGSTWFEGHCFALEPMKEMDPIRNFSEGIWTLTCVFLWAALHNSLQQVHCTDAPWKAPSWGLGKL